MTHESAQDYCKSLDERAQLAEIRSQEIQEFVARDVDLVYYYGQDYDWWLGGNDKAEV